MADATAIAIVRGQAASVTPAARCFQTSLSHFASLFGAADRITNMIFDSSGATLVLGTAGGRLVFLDVPSGKVFAEVGQSWLLRFL